MMRSVRLHPYLIHVDRSLLVYLTEAEENMDHKYTCVTEAFTKANLNYKVFIAN